MLDRKLLLSAFFAFALAPACAAPTEETAGGEEIEASTDAIVDMSQTAVKRQSVGNCWLYATASMAEGLAKAAGEDVNMSESYWTYWHWFDQIANGSAGAEITTGGFYSTAAEIISRYGIMAEADFIPAEANEERSLIQKSALAKINESLKTGTLSTPKARADRALVRKELNAAFEISEGVIGAMDQVFGDRVTRTLDRSNVSIAKTPIKRAKDIKAQLRDPQTRKEVTGTLADAIGKRGQSSWSPRVGKFAYKSVNYGWDETTRRRTLQRVQTAMHDKAPVIMTWYVDFAAMVEGRFQAPPATPGAQGGHMVVVDDYQVTDVPGFGTLSAGVVEERSDALNAALSPQAKFEFIRVKNSWGTHRPDPHQIGAGYNDLYMPYLNGPIKQCTQREGTSVQDECWDTTPLEEFILPAGY